MRKPVCDKPVCNKKFRSHLTSEFFLLHQHSDWIFQEPCQCLHELRGFGSLADAVVNGDSGFHTPARFDLSVIYDRDFSCGGDCQDRGFGWIDDGYEFFDIIHAKIGCGEC